jgi:hypothetical protein
MIRLPSSAKLIWPEMWRSPSRSTAGDIGGDGRGCLRQLDAQLGKALVDAHRVPQALARRGIKPRDGR